MSGQPESLRAMAHRLLNSVALISSYIDLLKNSGLTEDQKSMCDEMQGSALDAVEVGRELERRLGSGSAD